MHAIVNVNNIHKFRSNPTMFTKVRTWTDIKANIMGSHLSTMQ